MDIIELVSPKFISSLRTSRLPGHHIKLKIGTPILIIKNLDQSEVLFSGTCLIVTNMDNHVLEARIMGGKGHGNLIYIPCMDMSPSQSPRSFKLNRR